MKTIRLSLLTGMFYLCMMFPAVAGENATGKQERIPESHWSCREAAALAERYGTRPPTGDGGMVERKELCSCFVAVMEKVIEKRGEGDNAVPQEDLERLAALHEWVKDDLAGFEGYLKRREAIMGILSKPDLLHVLYTFGLNGFLRGEGAGALSLADAAYTPGHGEGRWVYRIKPYVLWHPADWIDLHVEGQGYGYRGGNSQEYGKFSLYQGWAELKTPGRDWLALRGGRQEFSYGSTFMYGADSFYDGASFDGGRLRIKPGEQLSLDLLIGSYARAFSGDTEGTLAGTYLAWAPGEGTGIEAYAFRDTGSTDRHAGEYVATWGFRGTAKAGPVFVEIEPVYQSGRVYNGTVAGNDRIDAYGGHVDLAVESQMAGFNNTFFFSWAIGSGSMASATEGIAHREFRNPNNETSLVGDLGLIGDLSGLDVNGHRASGMQIYTAGWGVNLTEQLNFTATGRLFRAEAVEAGFSRDLGVETDFTVSYAASDNLSIILGYDRFLTGDFFSDASGSGKDIDYGYVMLQFDLFHLKPKLKKSLI